MFFMYFIFDRIELFNFVYTQILFNNAILFIHTATRLNNAALWSFFSGIACLLAGVIITAIDMIFPHSFSTILEVDYDTPYDRHVIIEESFDTRGKDVRRKISSIEDTFNGQFMR